MFGANGLILMVPFMLGLFVVMARLELYFSKRRSHVAHARYLAEMQSSGGVGFRIRG